MEEFELVFVQNFVIGKLEKNIAKLFSLFGRLEIKNQKKRKNLETIVSVLSSRQKACHEAQKTCHHLFIETLVLHGFGLNQRF